MPQTPLAMSDTSTTEDSPERSRLYSGSIIPGARAKPEVRSPQPGTGWYTNLPADCATGFAHPERDQNETLSKPPRRASGPFGPCPVPRVDDRGVHGVYAVDVDPQADARGARKLVRNTSSSRTMS